MRRLFALLPLVLAWSCGYIGDPLPPALNIPQRVTDLAVVERGDKLLISFTIPALTTENLPLKNMGPPEIQIQDRTIESKAEKPGPHVEEIPARDYVGRDLTFRVRLNNGRGRFSAWSNQVVVHVVDPVQTPADLAAVPDPKGLRVTWQSPSRPGQTWILVREDHLDSPVPLNQPHFIDSETEFGKEYTYRVQAKVDKAESEMSAEVTGTPRNIFPPSVPTGLTVIQGIDTVELAWDPNPEPDVKGYRVYRGVGGGELQLLAGDVQPPSYSDKKVAGNQTYRYAVSAIDQADNESAKSQVAEIKTR